MMIKLMELSIGTSQILFNLMKAPNQVKQQVII